MVSGRFGRPAVRWPPSIACRGRRRPPARSPSRGPQAACCAAWARPGPSRSISVYLVLSGRGLSLAISFWCRLIARPSAAITAWLVLLCRRSASGILSRSSRWVSDSASSNRPYSTASTAQILLHVSLSTLVPQSLSGPGSISPAISMPAVLTSTGLPFSRPLRYAAWCGAYLLLSSVLPLARACSISPVRVSGSLRRIVSPSSSRRAGVARCVARAAPACGARLPGCCPASGRSRCACAGAPSGRCSGRR